MAKRNRPRRGSLAYKTKKRVSRLHPIISSYPSASGLLGFAGYKAGMIHVVVLDERKNSATKGEEIVLPATVLDCPKLIVIGIKCYKRTAYGNKSSSTIWSENINEYKDLERIMKFKKSNYKKISKIDEKIDDYSDIRLIVITQPRNSGIRKKTPEIFELGIGGNIKEKLSLSKEKLGKEIKISDAFRQGEFIDSISVTKGKGTQGVIKRFGTRRLPRKAKGKRRHIGSLGARTPQRVKWTVPQAGQLGLQNRTEYNKHVLKIGKIPGEINPTSGFKNYGLIKSDYILIKGSVSGPSKRLIKIRKGIRSTKYQPTQIKEIIL